MIGCSARSLHASLRVDVEASAEEPISYQVPGLCRTSPVPLLHLHCISAVIRPVKPARVETVDIMATLNQTKIDNAASDSKGYGRTPSARIPCIPPPPRDMGIIEHVSYYEGDSIGDGFSAHIAQTARYTLMDTHSHRVSGEQVA